MAFMERLRHGWNAFMNKDPTRVSFDYGQSFSFRPDRERLFRRSERSIVVSIFNRIALDASAIAIRHCRLDEGGRFKEFIESSLDDRLRLEANIDQTGRAFLQDVVMSLLDEGCIAICPIDTDQNPDVSGTFRIESMRVGKIVSWYPSHVKVNVYNDRTGNRQDVMFSKSAVAIVENPLYAVVNDRNSTMQRLMRKLSLLDVTDEQTASGKLNMIIQLPYIVKSELKRKEAEQRRLEVEKQLTTSKYGIAYIDGTEHITQLNRQLDNNLMHRAYHFSHR